MEKLKNNKKILIILAAVLIFILSVSLYLSFRPNIKFNESFEEIEYGTEYEYKDMVMSVQPKDAVVEYPEFKATEVGNYSLTFHFTKDNKTHSKNFNFKIVDTKKPKLTLYFIDENIKIKINDSSADILSNIHVIENFSVEGLSNKIKLSEEDYNAFVEDVKETNVLINEREITKEEDIHRYDISKNGIFYTTDLDVTKLGVYTIKVCVVDENYNSVETQWLIEVVDNDELLNSGGSVSCTYEGDDLQGSEAYSVRSIENYKYTPFRVVSEYEIITEMSFNDDYVLDDNIKLMMSELQNNYGSYNDLEGVTVSITNYKNIVTTSIKINFELYDRKKDPLDILANNSKSEIDMQSILDSAEENHYVCTFK